MLLVTGATGHVGNTLVGMLEDRDQPIRVLVQPHEDMQPLDGRRVEIVCGDIRDPLRILLRHFHDLIVELRIESTHIRRRCGALQLILSRAAHDFLRLGDFLRHMAGACR